MWLVKKTDLHHKRAARPPIMYMPRKHSFKIDDFAAWAVFLLRGEEYLRLPV